jgi:hypothetical protein
MLLPVEHMAHWFWYHQDRWANGTISMLNIAFLAAVSSFIALMSNLWESLKLSEGPILSHTEGHGRTSSPMTWRCSPLCGQIDAQLC